MAFGKLGARGGFGGQGVFTAKARFAPMVESSDLHRR